MEALKARPYFLKIVRWSTTAIFHFLTLLAVTLICIDLLEPSTTDHNAGVIQNIRLLSRVGVITYS